MRRVFAALLLAVIFSLPVSGCRRASDAPQVSPSLGGPSAPAEPSETPAGPTDIRIGGLKGPTSMGMAQLMEASQAGTAANNYTFTIAGSADELTPKLINGSLDIAAVPANLAAVLYNNTDKSIKLLAVNTLGVLYIVENRDSVHSLAELKGKTIYSSGKGSSPEYVLRYLLSENGIDPDNDVTIEWKSEHSELISILEQKTGVIALLPQPFVAIAQTQLEDLRIAVDLTQAWNELGSGSTLITGVLAVRGEFAERYPEQLAAFLDEYERSTRYVNENVSNAAILIEKFDIFRADIAQKAIPYCNITYLEGEQMKSAMEGYLRVLFEQNPKSVGGALPKDDFYYER